MRGSLSGKLVLSLTGNSGKESEDKCLFLRGPERKDCILRGPARWNLGTVTANTSGEHGILYGSTTFSRMVYPTQKVDLKVKLIIIDFAKNP